MEGSRHLSLLIVTKIIIINLLHDFVLLGSLASSGCRNVVLKVDETGKETQKRMR